MFFDRLNAMMKFILQFKEVYKTSLAGLGNRLSLLLMDDFSEVAFSPSRLQTELSIYAFR